MKSISEEKRGENTETNINLHTLIKNVRYTCYYLLLSCIPMFSLSLQLKFKSCQAI